MIRPRSGPRQNFKLLTEQILHVTKKSKWWSVTSKVYHLNEIKKQGNLDNSVSIPQWRNPYLKGRHSLRQNGTHTPCLHSCGQRWGRSWVCDRPSSTEHRTPILHRLPGSSSNQVLLPRPGLFQTLFTMAEALHRVWFHAVLCFFFNISGTTLHLKV